MRSFKLFLLPLVACLALTACSQESAPAGKSSIESNTTSTNKTAAAAPAATGAASDAAAANPAGGAKDEVAVIKTSEGTMVAEFWPDVAPKTVENFKKLAKENFYNGTAFHRVIKGFMIQGGDPYTKDESKEAMWGQGGPGYTVKAEFNDRPHKKGVLSMARSADPDSAGSQFFICHGDPSFLDHQYTTFGQLIKGTDVLDKIANTPTHPQDRPDKRMNIDSISIMPRSEAMK
ncbi:MAG: peptidyl-prolyl cis-trans isomerase cyclophilin type [Verrucomicrobiales bacterium]|nr:peptidyl-prolyl cis-trans isomerase cyclophilin type [Verrucomicrobiales bacterium]